MRQPSVLCPIDYSDGSGEALRHAAAIAALFGARLTLLAVNDPLLYEALALTGAEPHLDRDTEREVGHFFERTLDRQASDVADVRIEVVPGTPATEILRVSRSEQADLIVMSSHGATGFRKLFFGSTTERVLRETTIPVLVTPGHAPGPVQLEDMPRLVRRVLAPVDLTPATPHQVGVASRLADALGVPLLLLNVVEPIRASPLLLSGLPSIEGERRARAERELDALLDSIPPHVRREGLVAYGETAEEIAKVAADRDAGLIVMGLHSSPVLGPRMGSVTYRVLCLAHRAILALPPLTAEGDRQAWLHAPAVSSAPPPSPRPRGAGALPSPVAVP